MTDAMGYVRFSTVKTGDTLMTDGGFTCMNANESKIVKCDKHGKGRVALFITCRDGKHFLDGQENEKGFLVGLRRPKV